MVLSVLLLAVFLCSSPEVVSAQRLLPTPPGGTVEYCQDARVCRPYRGVHFPTSSLGYVWTRFELFRTTDAGKSWEPLLGPATQGKAVKIQEMRFVDTATFFVLGDPSFRTVDGGSNFVELPSKVPALWAPGEGHELLDLSFINPALGWAVGSPADKTQALLHTSDGGLTWNVSRRISRKLRGAGRIWMFGEQEGLLATGRGVARTENGGRSWEVVVPDSRGLRLRCARDSAACMVEGGRFGVFHLSTDRGKTWEKYGLGLDRNLDSIYDFRVFAPDLAAVVGAHSPTGPSFHDNITDFRTPLPVLPTPAPDRALLLLWDGTTWHRREYPEFAALWSIDYVSPTEIWASADNNGIIHSNDGGQTWEFVLDYYRQKALTPSPAPTTPAPSPSS